MEGLLQRLSGDSEAEDGLRVVLFFDRLISSHGRMEDLVRSCARLVGAAAGYSATDAHPRKGIAFDPRGHSIDMIPESREARLVNELDPGDGSVWVGDHENEGSPLAALILERFAFSAAIIASREPQPPARGERHDVIRLLSLEASVSDRIQSARSLGFRPEWMVRAVVCHITSDSLSAQRQLNEWVSDHSGRSTEFVVQDGCHVAIVRDDSPRYEPGLPPANAVAGVGPRRRVLAAADSLHLAHEALRLTSHLLGPRLVDYETLGTLRHLANVPSEEASSTELVQKLRFLTQSPNGRGELVALEAFCRLRSLRIASTEMHLHHSSLSNRLRNVERKLGVDLADPHTLLQVILGLQLFRVAEWSSEPATETHDDHFAGGTA